MKTVYANRASSIIYNVLKSKIRDGIFILPANICPIVPLVFFKAGYKFEFIDITLNDYLIDKNEVLLRLLKNRGKYSGILFNRTYGMISSVEAFFGQIKDIDKNIIIIDDRCLSIPSFSVKTMHADITLYSTGKTKYTNGPPGGFAHLNNNISYYESNKREWNPDDLSNIIDSYKHSVENKIKFNYVDSGWLDISRPKWSIKEHKDKVKANLEAAVQIKKEINRIYFENLPKPIQLPLEYQNWRFNIMVPNKEKVLLKIFQNGLFASSHYASLGNIFAPGEFKNASSLHSKVINLFNDRHYSQTSAEKTCEIINKYL